ncbi:MAG: hypothetical protein V3T76_09705 [candidate division NC10 bacterium]
MVSIRPGYLTFYSEYCGVASASRVQHERAPLPERNRSDGLISDKAQRKISQSIDWMLELAKAKPLFPDDPENDLLFKLNLITLTLSSEQVHDDATIKKMLLQPFLDTLRKTWNCKVYFWRAESQQNGNIHFHIITDVYIQWWKIRKRWNAIQNQLGYVDRWVCEEDEKDPNSTDIHSIEKVENLGAYLSKYCSKNPKGAMYTACKLEGGQLVPCYNPSEALNIYSAGAEMFRSIGGRLWGVSYVVSKIKSAVICVHDIIDSSLHQLWKVFGSEAKEYDYHTCIYKKVSEWSSAVRGQIYDAFQDYVQEFQHLRPPEKINTGSCEG